MAGSGVQPAPLPGNDPAGEGPAGNASMMLQLNPMIPFWHVASGQACHAFMAIDYSQEHDLMFTVIMQGSGEIWVCRAAELRGQENITLGRVKQPRSPTEPV